MRLILSLQLLMFLIYLHFVVVLSNLCDRSYCLVTENEIRDVSTQYILNTEHFVQNP